MLKAQGIEFTENARKVSDWQKQLEKERETRSKEFQKTSADTSDNYKAISRSLGAILRDTLTSTGAAEGWEKFTSRIRQDIEKTELAMRNMNTPQMRAASERAREVVATPNQKGPLTNQERGLPVQEYLTPEQAERRRAQMGRRRGAAGAISGSTPQRFMGGGDEFGAHGPYAPVTGGLEGGGIMAGSPLSDSLEDRRSENENTRKTEDNTAELKRLNEMLVFSQQGAAVGGGLAGQLGLGDIGKGGGGAPAGGGAPSMSGWTGGAGRSRAPGGAISTGGATTTGDAGSAGMPVIAGAGGVPGEILKRAQEVALQGGPGAVDQFMRSQGYPKNGAWCGQFAASVVKSTGGTPPANPQVASNWRNWGTKVDVPQPGDVAVRRGPTTGSTGSHVTFVQSVGQGTFAGLGGNQSNQAKVSQFATGRFDFFRGQGSQGQPSATQQTQGGMTPQTAGGNAPGLPAGPTSGQGTYQKMLNAFQGSPLIGKVPPDGAKFGIRTGSAEEWARFGTAVAKAESNFNPRTANTSDPGGSFGILQYAHGQVPGGNAYNVDASISAFVRDAQQSVGVGSLERGLLGRRFSTIGRHPERTIRNLANYPGMVPGARAICRRVRN